jgi:hypothetical protein
MAGFQWPSGRGGLRRRRRQRCVRRETGRGCVFLAEEEVDEDLSDDVLDGAVTDAGVEPVVVVRDIGEGVHACGGFFGQLVDLGFDVFGGLFGGHGSFRPC